MATLHRTGGGLFSSVRAFGDSIITGLHNRLELISLELQEEKLRLIQIFIWISAAIFSAVMAIMFGSFFLVYVFWESARLTVLGGLSLLYLGGLAAIVISFKRFIARQPLPFAATIQELKNDSSCIQTES